MKKFTFMSALLALMLVPVLVLTACGGAVRAILPSGLVIHGTGTQGRLFMDAPEITMTLEGLDFFEAVSVQQFFEFRFVGTAATGIDTATQTAPTNIYVTVPAGNWHGILETALEATTGENAQPSVAAGLVFWWLNTLFNDPDFETEAAETGRVSETVVDPQIARQLEPVRPTGNMVVSVRGLLVDMSNKTTRITTSVINVTEAQVTANPDLEAGWQEQITTEMSGVRVNATAWVNAGTWTRPA